MTSPRPRAAIAIVWQATEPAPRGLQAWLARLLAGYLVGLGHSRAGLVLLIGDDALLRRLNARFRRRDRPTDILSFGNPSEAPRRGRAGTGAGRSRGGAGGSRAGAGPARAGAGRAPAAPLGELAVSWQRVVAQAEAHGWPPRTELARLLAHGCVHLLGLDHRTRAEDAAMLRKEQRLLRAAGFPGLYPGKSLK